MQRLMWHLRGVAFHLSRIQSDRQREMASKGMAGIARRHGRQIFDMSFLVSPPKGKPLDTLKKTSQVFVSFEHWHG